MQRRSLLKGLSGLLLAAVIPKIIAKPAPALEALPIVNGGTGASTYWRGDGTWSAQPADVPLTQSTLSTKHLTQTDIFTIYYPDYFVLPQSMNLTVDVISMLGDGRITITTSDEPSKNYIREWIAGSEERVKSIGADGTIPIPGNGTMRIYFGTGKLTVTQPKKQRAANRQQRVAQNRPKPHGQWW